MRAEVVPQELGKVNQTLSWDTSRPLRHNSTNHMMTWTVASSLRLAGCAVRFRFILHQSHLYSFWVSTDADGRSAGFLGTGAVGLHLWIHHLCTYVNSTYRWCTLAFMHANIVTFRAIMSCSGQLFMNQNRVRSSKIHHLLLFLHTTCVFRK